MTGGGFLIALDTGLFGRVEAMLVESGALTAVEALSGGVVQLTDPDGRLFTLFEHDPPGLEWEVREGPFRAAQGVVIPDMAQVTACPFACRWPDIVARVAAAAARTTEAPTWVLDGDGVVWDAERVDPDELRL
jgi:hypothetical protein